MRCILLTLILGLLLPLPRAEAAKRKQHATFVPTIVAVKANSISVKTGRNEGYKVSAPDENGLQKTAPDANTEIYKVTQSTKVTINAKPAKLSDLKKGMEVRVTVGVDRSTASEIAAKIEP